MRCKTDNLASLVRSHSISVLAFLHVNVEKLRDKT